MNRHALSWADTALEYERECAQLRRLCVVLLLWIARHHDLCNFADGEIIRRWPEAEEPRA